MRLGIIEKYNGQPSTRAQVMKRFSPWLKSAAVIKYIAIALIGTGIYERSESRILLGAGLLVPTKVEQVDRELEKSSK